MPTLNWIGKDKVVNYHNVVRYKPLIHIYGYRPEDPENKTFTNSGNKIIHGDNVEAEKSLLLEYRGGIKCIYIDPPYNTGEEKWIYNDNVNDPRIKKWIGEVVGNEGEDLTRHDKWLCMMYPRLKLLEQLLSEDGVIFISIDDNELANLKLICDEIFGRRNFVELFSWHKTLSPSNLSKKTKKCLDYIICYAKDISKVRRFNGMLKVNEADNPLIKKNNTYKRLTFPQGCITSTLKKDVTFKAGDYGTKKNKVKLINDVEYKGGKFNKDLILESNFVWDQDKLDYEISRGTKIIFKGKSFALRYDKLVYDNEVPRNLIDDEDHVGTTESGGKLLAAIFGGVSPFPYPKDVTLIMYLLNLVCDKDDVILDSFAGSGTTAHAVLNLNKQDGGNRKFILIDVNDYADTLTAERVRRVMKGYSYGKETVEGTGGAFDFYELGEPIFDENGDIKEDEQVEVLRRYIYFCETKKNLTRKPTPDNKYILDTYNNTGYYFYYEMGTYTTLSLDTLDIIKEKAEQYIIYADSCTLSRRELDERHIIFKKIPRDIQKF